MAGDIISSLEIIEKLLFPETDFWHDNYLNKEKLSVILYFIINDTFNIAL